jgi:hypothetical protein
MTASISVKPEGYEARLEVELYPASAPCSTGSVKCCQPTIARISLPTMERSRGIRPNDYARCLRGQTKPEEPSEEVRCQGLLLWRKGLLVVVMVEYGGGNAGGWRRIEEISFGSGCCEPGKRSRNEDRGKEIGKEDSLVSGSGIIERNAAAAEDWPA